MTIQEIKMKLSDGFLSDYCSLRDEDEIEFATLKFDESKVEEILEELKSLSSKIDATTYASLSYYDFVSFEFDKEPEYHKVDTIRLSSDGIITIESSSRHDSLDCFETTVGI